jgi:hypothetical protein
MSKLEDVSIPYRKTLVAKNTYDINDPYSGGHSNALSNGDELGKGEMNGQVGSATDIKVRNTLMAKNKFDRNREYNAGTA